jgi:hexokinase
MSIARHDSVSAGSAPHALFHRTQDEENTPHATKKCAVPVLGVGGQSPRLNGSCRKMTDHLRKYESVCAPIPTRAGTEAEAERRRFTLTPQRMRMIVESFRDALELGLEKPGQIVVCPCVCRPSAAYADGHPFPRSR